MKRLSVAALGLSALALLGLSTASAPSNPTGAECVRCHEMDDNHAAWKVSTHKSVDCTGCHEATMSNKLRRLAAHVKDELPEKFLLAQTDVEALVTRCRSCHQTQFADWQRGPHGSNFSKIFLDSKHNAKRLMMDDCLRCHGMFFEGGVRDLVSPVDTKGPWKLVRPADHARPVMPCLACHAVHREGKSPAKLRPSLALYDRREQDHIPLENMAIPAVHENGRSVRISPDRRQALCYQCHAPLATNAAWSGDDRTPLGVHEGLSCLACHQGHTQDAKASCANCHPRLSNCGLDVEKMDTTFKDAKSRFNIHTVKCADCHPRGVPKPAIGSEASRRRSSLPRSPESPPSSF
ncbi:MAG: cytochrome c3 family protein [Bryobacteraceae bacterium]|nr:cytochrome c3 family protein [Bryobacteraceae bacterium]